MKGGRETACLKNLIPEKKFFRPFIKIVKDIPHIKRGYLPWNKGLTKVNASLINYLGGLCGLEKKTDI